MPPVLAIIGKPNCGKTTLLEKLIPALCDRGLSIGTIKHHHGDIEMDIPGKDTWRHKQAGARTVLLSSPTGIGLIQDVEEDSSIEDLVSQYFKNHDLVIAEGYKWSTLPKIEVFRSAVYDEPMNDPGNTLIAMVSDVDARQGLPHFGFDEIEPLTDFILEQIVNS
ncbi:MAG: molybdopterin-guanine dinucleotide biosynthesis protein B [Deltaproteobacteria bacterium]|nr:MAG: molybdopterin-guanine dinucleotide biosynthesis protein B [Deltaproteobacteria bacterium]